MCFVCLSVFDVFFYLSVFYAFHICLSVCYAFTVCLSCVHFHCWGTLKKLPIAYRLSPQRIPSERNIFIFLFDYKKILSVCLLWIFICERLWKCCLSPIAYHLKVERERIIFITHRKTMNHLRWLVPQGIPSERNVFISCLTITKLCLSVCNAFLSVCLTDMLFHFWGTLRKLPIAYRLSLSVYKVSGKYWYQTAVLVHA